MRLSQVILRGYRTVPGELKIFVRPTLTCMIGANEHGKTNILDAIDLLKAGTFKAYDRNANLKTDSHPELVFTLKMVKEERAALVDALKKEIAARVSSEDAEAVKDRVQMGHCLKYYSSDSDSSLEFTVMLRANGYRGIHLQFSWVSVSKTSKFTFVREWYANHVPTVYLFASSEELADSITLEELNNGANLPFVGVLKLAGVWEERAVLFEGDVGAHRLIERAEGTLTRKIRRIWSQGAAHSFRFNESSGRLHLSIKDPATFDTPSRRSLGFRSFFSFYLTLYAETNEVDPEGYILLFDEPGIHLHPQGQKDLLRELRRLSRRNQLIYTTHSPFMIDRNDPAATLLVRKGFTKKEKGTHVVYKVYGSNWAPLASALGIAPADALFPPESILLVEGTSDRLYIGSFMRHFQPATSADLNALYMIDADRREEMEAHVRMLLGLDRQVTVLADGDRGGANFEKRLKKIAGAKSGKLSFIDLRKIAGLDKEVSIEDLLPRAQWLEAIQQYVAEILNATLQLDSEEIERRAVDVSMGRAVAEYLAEKSVIQSPSKFSKTTVADLFCRQELTVPADSVILKLCSEITKSLGIGDY
jgi:predicted ATP-dependent endonuclease of OLD family